MYLDFLREVNGESGAKKYYGPKMHLLYRLLYEKKVFKMVDRLDLNFGTKLLVYSTVAKCSSSIFLSLLT